MTLVWVREENPVWDDDKDRVIGGAPEGAFVLDFGGGESLPGEWWSAQDGDAIVGFGRLDVTWGGDAEILLAVDPGHQEQGIGSFVLARLEEEATARGINYVHNRIREHSRVDHAAAASYAAGAADQAPGHEEQGGYVNVDDHQY